MAHFPDETGLLIEEVPPAALMYIRFMEYEKGSSTKDSNNKKVKENCYDLPVARTKMPSWF